MEVTPPEGLPTAQAQGARGEQACFPGGHRAPGPRRPPLLRGITHFPCSPPAPGGRGLPAPQCTSPRYPPLPATCASTRAPGEGVHARVRRVSAQARPWYTPQRAAARLGRPGGAAGPSPPGHVSIGAPGGGRGAPGPARGEAAGGSRPLLQAHSSGWGGREGAFQAGKGRSPCVPALAAGGRAGGWQRLQEEEGENPSPLLPHPQPGSRLEVQFLPLSLGFLRAAGMAGAPAPPLHPLGRAGARRRVCPGRGRRIRAPRCVSGRPQTSWVLGTATRNGGPGLCRAEPGLPLPGRPGPPSSPAAFGEPGGPSRPEGPEGGSLAPGRLRTPSETSELRWVLSKIREEGGCGLWKPPGWRAQGVATQPGLALRQWLSPAPALQAPLCFGRWPTWRPGIGPTRAPLCWQGTRRGHALLRAWLTAASPRGSARGRHGRSWSRRGLVSGSLTLCPSCLPGQAG